MRSITEMVKNGQEVAFVGANDHELRYATNDGFEFGVPIEDLGDGTFLARDKAMLFMRYIRKARDAMIATGQAHESADGGTGAVINDDARGEVNFLHARKGALWYVTNDGFEFPVPFVALTGTTYRASGHESDFDVFMAQHRDGIEMGRKGAAFMNENA